MPFDFMSPSAKADFFYLLSWSSVSEADGRSWGGEGWAHPIWPVTYTPPAPSSPETVVSDQRLTGLSASMLIGNTILKLSLVHNSFHVVIIMARANDSVDLEGHCMKYSQSTIEGHDVRTGSATEELCSHVWSWLFCFGLVFWGFVAAISKPRPFPWWGENQAVWLIALFGLLQTFSESEKQMRWPQEISSGLSVLGNQIYYEYIAAKSIGKKIAL